MKDEAKRRPLNIWSIIGKISVIVGIIGGSIFIINSVRVNRIDAVAYASSSMFEEPKFLELYFDQLYDKLHSDTLSTLLNENANYINKQNILDYLRTDFPIYNRLWFVHNKNFIELEIKNKGDKELTDLLIHFPSEGYYSVYLNDNLLDSDHYEDYVEIGHLRANNIMKIHLWFVGYVHKDFENDINITSPDGIIKVKGYRKVKDLLALIYDKRYFFNPFSLICFVVSLLAFLFLISYSIIKKYDL